MLFDLQHSSILVNYLTIEDLATYLHSSFHISGRDMQFTSSGSGYHELMEVPLVGPGQLKSLSVRITVTLKPVASGVDSDPRVGLTDGDKQQLFTFADRSNYPTYTPCLASGNQDNILVPASTPPPAEYSLLFNPFLGYGSCSTAQVGGYVNTATFAQTLDTRRGLTLIVLSADIGEHYNFTSILVELL